MDSDTTSPFSRTKAYCDNHEALRPELPKPGTMWSFKNYNMSMKVPFIVYADF